jgi:hypothetical protein
MNKITVTLFDGMNKVLTTKINPDTFVIIYKDETYYRDLFQDFHKCQFEKISEPTKGRYNLR